MALLIAQRSEQTSEEKKPTKKRQQRIVETEVEDPKISPGSVPLSFSHRHSNTSQRTLYISEVPSYREMTKLGEYSLTSLTSIIYPRTLISSICFDIGMRVCYNIGISALVLHYQLCSVALSCLITIMNQQSCPSHFTSDFPTRLPYLAKVAQRSSSL